MKPVAHDELCGAEGPQRLAVGRFQEEIGAPEGMVDSACRKASG